VPASTPAVDLRGFWAVPCPPPFFFYFFPFFLGSGPPFPTRQNGRRDASVQAPLYFFDAVWECWPSVFSFFPFLLFYPRLLPAGKKDGARCVFRFGFFFSLLLLVSPLFPPRSFMAREAWGKKPARIWLLFFFPCFFLGKNPRAEKKRREWGQLFFFFPVPLLRKKAKRKLDLRVRGGWIMLHPIPFFLFPFSFSLLYFFLRDCFLFCCWWLCRRRVPFFLPFPPPPLVFFSSPLHVPCTSRASARRFRRTTGFFFSPPSLNFAPNKDQRRVLGFPFLWVLVPGSMG